MKSPNPFSGGVDALSDADFALLVDAVETRRCRELVGAGTYDEAARKWRPRPRCPSCSYEGCASDGSTCIRQLKSRHLGMLTFFRTSRLH